MKICPTCKREFEDDQIFCGECGSKLEFKRTFCTKCGNEITPDQQFCGQCGTKINSSSSNLNAGKIAHEIRSKTEKVTRVANEKTKELLSDKNVGEVKRQITSNAEEAREKISDFSQSIQSSEFSFDFLKMFPTSDSQYDAYIKFALINVVIGIVAGNISVFNMTSYNPSELLTIMTLLIELIAFIFTIYVLGYITIKAGILKYLGKIFLGLILMPFIWSIGKILGPAGIFVLFFVSVCFAIHTNYKRKAILKKYSRYILYPIGIIFMMIVFNIFTYYLYCNNSIVYGTVVSAFGFTLVFLIMRRFMRNEQAKGISFLDMQRLMFIVPFTAIFYIFSFLTIFHFFDVSPDNVLADTSVDINPTTSTDLTQHINNDLLVNNSLETDNLTPTATNNTTAESDSTFHEQTLGDTLASSSGLNEIQPVSVTDNSTVTNVDGTPVMRFDSQTGILYDKNGQEIIHLVNNNLVTTNGRIIAIYNPDTNLFYDGFNQPLDVKINDSTFQHVKDVHGNGIEIINDEIFDAKTHERIGVISKNEKI